MSYKIVYDNMEGKYEIRRTSGGRIWIMTLSALAIFLVLTCSFWSEGAAVIRKTIVSEELTRCLQAMGMLTDDLRCGASITDSVEAFCREILYGTNDQG